MFTLMPTMGVGYVGALITTIAMAADWYIWKFRYRISRRPLAAPPKNEDVIHASSASGRELLLIPAPQPVNSDIAARQIKGESMEFSSTKLISVTAAGIQFGPPGYECDILYLACSRRLL
jgi:hypothetical protein